jgi:hypothetical protein
MSSAESGDVHLAHSGLRELVRSPTSEASMAGSHQNMNSEGHALNATLSPFSHLPLPLDSSYMPSAHSRGHIHLAGLRHGEPEGSPHNSKSNESSSQQNTNNDGGNQGRNDHQDDGAGEDGVFPTNNMAILPTHAGMDMNLFEKIIVCTPEHFTDADCTVTNEQILMLPTHDALSCNGEPKEKVSKRIQASQGRMDRAGERYSKEKEYSR